MTDEDDYWFPAKRYGWGWGPPTRWQGWLALAVALGFDLILALRTMPRDPLGFMFGTLVSTLLLVAVCYVKGEPPAWRWGQGRD